VYKSDYFQQKKTFLTLINYVQNEGSCPRRDKKGKKKKKKNSRKVNGLKKRGGGPKAKLVIVLDSILLHRPQSAGPFPRSSPRFPKEKENSKRKGNRAADEDTKDNLTGRLQARSPADR
jgi:hypothetical protein